MGTGVTREGGWAFAIDLGLSTLAVGSAHRFSRRLSVQRKPLMTPFYPYASDSL